MANKSNPTQSKEVVAVKTPYKSSALSVNSDIREPTQIVGNAGMIDGGAGMMQRTQP